MSGNDNIRGYSLLELLAVLVLMAMVAATVMPRFIGTGSTDTQAAARTLAAGLRRARSQAIQHSQTASLTLDVQRHEFELSFEKRARKLPRGVGLKLFTARSAVETAERGAIRFFSDGGSTGGRITVSGPNNEMLVDVDWLSGRVSVLTVGRSSVQENVEGLSNRNIYAAAGTGQAGVITWP